jgi:hypothetical protein
MKEIVLSEGGGGSTGSVLYGDTGKTHYLRAWGGTEGVRVQAIKDGTTGDDPDDVICEAVAQAGEADLAAFENYTCIPGDVVNFGLRAGSL